MNHPEVLVAGAGPVGQFAALTLARRGVNVAIADTGVWPCKHSYALALHPQSVNLMGEVGLRDEILAAAHLVHSVALCDKSGPRARIKLDEGLAVVRQDLIEEMFDNALAGAGVKVHWRHDVAEVTPSATGVSAKINRLEKDSRGYAVAHNEWVVGKTLAIETPYVIGADGYNSRVRRTLGYQFPEVGEAQYFAVFEFKSGAQFRDEVRVVFADDATSVLWPLPNGGCRWSFELPGYRDPGAEELKDKLLAAGLGYFPTERPKDRVGLSDLGQMPILDEVHLRYWLEHRAPWFQLDINQITWRTVVRFERRLAPAFGSGRLWLAGDAAHLTGPGGIQSMNLGFFEAFDIANAIAEKSATKLEAASARWSAEWRRLHGLDGGLRSRSDVDPWVAQHSAALMSCLPGHGSALNAMASQLYLEA